MKNIKNVLSGIIAVITICSAALPVSATEENVTVTLNENQSLVLSENNGKKYYEIDGKNKTEYATSIRIKTNGENENGFTVESGNHNIIFENVKFNDSVVIMKNATANISLEGKNEVTAGINIGSSIIGIKTDILGKAGINVPEGATLNLSGTGELTVQGSCSIFGNGGAGIGGNNDENAGNIKITGAKIKAIAGKDAEPIGGGCNKFGSGKITVNDKKIYQTQRKEWKNNKIFYNAEPIFSKVGGFYDTEFDLTLSDTDGNKILYTTDGSDPRTSDTAKTYSEAIKIYDNTNEKNVLSDNLNIGFGGSDTHHFPSLVKPNYNVDKGIIVKAVCCDNYGNYGPIAVNGYYINKTKSYYKDMKVISISTDSSNLFGDEKGIITECFDDKLENPCNLQVYDKGEIVYTEDIGIKIAGAFSRNFARKSFTLSAKEKYGAKKMKYDFFDGNVTDVNGNVINKFDKIKLRSGGNDQFETSVRDDINHMIAKDCKFCTQGSENCVLFLNGEFWGFYTIREQKNEDYISSHYGVDADKVTICSGGSVKEDDSQVCKDYVDFFDWMQNADMTNTKNYERVCNTIDIESYIQYIAFQEYFNNADWPKNNWKMWRTTEIDPSNPYADGKWRYIFFDTDISTGEAFQWNNYDTTCEGTRLNAMKKDDITNCGCIFDAVIHNPQFAKDFYEYYISLPETKCKVSVTDELIDSVGNSIKEAMLDTFKRYGYSDSEDYFYSQDYLKGTEGYTKLHSQKYFEAGIKRMKEFFRNRPSYAKKKLDEYYKKNTNYFPAKLNLKNSVLSEDNGLIYSDITKQYLTSTQFIPAKDLKISIGEGYSYKFAKYSSDDKTRYLGSSEWMDGEFPTDKLSEDCKYVRIAVKRNDDKQITTKDKTGFKVNGKAFTLNNRAMLSDGLVYSNKVNTSRLSDTQYFETLNISEIEVGNNYQYAIAYYNDGENGKKQFVKLTDWTSEKTTIDTSYKYYRITVKKADGSVLKPTENIGLKSM